MYFSLLAIQIILVLIETLWNVNWYIPSAGHGGSVF